MRVRNLGFADLGSTVWILASGLGWVLGGVIRLQASDQNSTEPTQGYYKHQNSFFHKAPLLRLCLS